MVAFDTDVEGVSPEVSLPKKCRMASLTITGTWVNVLMQTAMMDMLVNATLPRGDIYGHLGSTACARRSRENVRTCESSECMNECRGTKQLGRQFGSSG